MSEFFKALGQAERDRALRQQGKIHQEPPPATEVAPVEGTPPSQETLATETVHREETAAVETREVAPASRWASPFLRKPDFFGGRKDRNPEHGDTALEGLDAHFVSLVTPATFEAEQYRALRHMIEEAHMATGLTVVAVSSPSVGDGKTTTAINLAGALAQSPNARVLLIDADLRRPAIGRHLGLQTSPTPGLVGALTDRTLTVAATVRRRPPFTLDILPAGEAPAAPYELLRSARLAELMVEARHRYDYIVLDTPPIVAVPDCRVLASFVDGFVIVVAAHRTPKRLVQDALGVVDPAKVIGLLFNMDERPLAGYYREYSPAINGNGHRKRRWGWR